MSVNKKYLDKFLADGWIEYKGTKEPMEEYEGDE